jgi:hypothetical protein
MPLLGKALQVGGGVFHLPFAQLDFEGAPSSIIAVVVLGSAWVCQLPRAYGNGGHGRR